MKDRTQLEQIQEARLAWLQRVPNFRGAAQEILSATPFWFATEQANDLFYVTLGAGAIAVITFNRRTGACTLGQHWNSAEEFVDAFPAFKRTLEPAATA